MDFPIFGQIFGLWLDLLNNQSFYFRLWIKFYDISQDPINIEILELRINIFYKRRRCFIIYQSYFFEVYSLNISILSDIQLSPGTPTRERVVRAGSLSILGRREGLPLLLGSQ